jgi:hypothetical protein
MPAVWLDRQYADDLARNDYRARHDLGKVPEDIRKFSIFYEARRERISKRLRDLLGIEYSSERLADEEESLAG